jgi:hypothetical protein
MVYSPTLYIVTKVMPNPNGRPSSWNPPCCFKDTKLIRVPKVLADRLLEMAHQMHEDRNLRFPQEGESIVSDEYLDSLERSAARARRLEQLIAEANGGMVPEY